MRVETRARARALQALYAWDLRGQVDLERVATQIWDDLSVPPEERRIAGRLVRTVKERGAVLDADIREVTTNWRLERLGVIERCVLRLAAAELQQGETPPRVILRESIRALEQRLAPHDFLRVHRSALVNLARVRELRRPAQGEWVVVLRGGVELPVSRRLRPAVTRYFATRA